MHRGRAEYFVGLESLREPFAFGIGVVRPDSNVNSALGWTPYLVAGVAALYVQHRTADTIEY